MRLMRWTFSRFTILSSVTDYFFTFSLRFCNLMKNRNHSIQICFSIKNNDQGFRLKIPYKNLRNFKINFNAFGIEFSEEKSSEKNAIEMMRIHLDIGKFMLNLSKFRTSLTNSFDLNCNLRHFNVHAFLLRFNSK